MADEYIEKGALLAKCAYEQPWGADAVIAMIEDFPAADVAPVRHGFDTKESRYFHCSECDYGVSDVFEDGPTLVFERQKEWRFCPNCGARVDGGDLDG